MPTTEFLPKITADIIAWERVQFTFVGRLENVDTQNIEFCLVNGDTDESVALRDVQIQQDRFLLRINITTVYGDRTFLPDGKWNMFVKSTSTGALFPIIAAGRLFSDEGFSDRFVKQAREEKLNRYAKTYVKGSFSSYTVAPAVHSGDRLFINITYVHPEPDSALKKTKKLFRKIFSPLINTVLRFGFFTVYNVTKLLTHHKGNRLVFCSDSRADLSGNMQNVYDRMIERGLDRQFKISFVLKESVKARRGFFDKFRAPFLLARADIVIIDDFNPTIKQLKFKPYVKVIQLWHACGAFKTVGFSRTGKPGGPFLTNTNHRAYTHAIASSSHVARFYCEAFGMRPESVLPTGVPRTDIFFDEEYKKATTDALHEAIPQTVGKRVILFAPTFRGKGAKTGHYPLHSLDMHALADLCRRTNSVFIFKMHPFVKDEVYIPDEFSDVLIDESAEREINNLLFITDMLITDYSSVIYEASILDIPMLFYAYDLQEYISSRDFYEPFEGFVPGRIVSTFDELIAAIESGECEQEKVKPFCERNFEYRDGGSTDRVIDWLILDEMPEKYRS